MKSYNISDKHLDEFIKLSEKEGHKYANREEARVAANNLVGFVDTLVESEMEKQRKNERLKDEPDGFSFSGEGRGCSLCGRHISGDMWWDKWGQKCMDCQEAYKKKIIPGYCFRDYDNEKHITIDKLTWKFEIPAQTLNKLIRDGEIKVRIIKGNGTRVVLRRENPELGDILSRERSRLTDKKANKSS